MRKTIALALTLVSVLALALSACAPKEPQPGTSPAASAAPAETALPGESAAPASTEQMTLNVLGKTDSIDKTVLDDFKAAYPNITLNYETIAGDEDVLAKATAQGAAYDLCFAPDYAVGTLTRLGLLAELDKGKLSNLANIGEQYAKLAFDPDGKYAVPYLWGTVGVLYNTKMVNEEVNSWSILWDDRYEKQILMPDSARVSLGVALKKLGYSVNTKNADELAQAEAEMVAQKPLVAAYGTNELRAMMIDGSAALAVMTSGDALLCMRDNPDLAYDIPREGSAVRYDNMVVLKNGKSEQAAYLFIDYLCRADVAQRNSQATGLSTPNKAALEKLGDDLKKSPVFSPSQEILGNCETYTDLGDIMKNYTDAWARVKAAK